MKRAWLLAALGVPVATLWARRAERKILRAGFPLTEAQLAIARQVGVREPERVRICVTDCVPPRLPRGLQRTAERVGLVSRTTSGMALGYGIYLRRDQCERRDLLLHELVHTAQYERLGGLRPFLRQYLQEFFALGYPFGALEREASAVTQEICARESTGEESRGSLSS